MDYAEQYSQAQALLDQPGHIKAHLPVAFVMEQYGIQLSAGEGRLHGVCPFHADHDPSMDVYPWGAGERWGCFACGAGGDVLDFVQKMSGVGFREACEICLRGIDRMKALGWQKPALTAQFEWNEAAATELWRCASTGGLEEIVVAKGWCFPASHLTATWGCRAQGSELLVPVWDEHKNMVGLKHRPLNGSRSLISLPGSRLRTTLYGAHLLRPADSHNHLTLVVEGESDAWTASWLLRGTPWSVLGLPAGAGASPTRLDLFAGRAPILALDGDDAGRLSAGRWKDALGPFAVVLDLPDGDDITSVEKAEPGWLKGRLEER